MFRVKLLLGSKIVWKFLRCIELDVTGVIVEQPMLFENDSEKAMYIKECTELDSKSECIQLKNIFSVSVSMMG